MLGLIDIGLNFIYYGPSMIMARFHFSLYASGMMLGIAQLLPTVIAIFLINILPRRMVSLVTLTVIFIACIIITFMWDQYSKSASSSGTNMTVMLLVCLIQGLTAFEFAFFVLYICELYPTQVRVLGIGFIKTFGSVPIML